MKWQTEWTAAQWLERSHSDESELDRMLLGSGKFVLTSALPFPEAETWAWNSASNEVTSLFLSWLCPQHPAATTGLGPSQAHTVLVLSKSLKYSTWIFHS